MLRTGLNMTEMLTRAMIGMLSGGERFRSGHRLVMYIECKAYKGIEP